MAEWNRDFDEIPKLYADGTRGFGGQYTATVPLELAAVSGQVIKSDDASYIGDPDGPGLVIVTGGVSFVDRPTSYYVGLYDPPLTEDDEGALPAGTDPQTYFRQYDVLRTPIDYEFAGDVLLAVLPVQHYAAKNFVGNYAGGYGRLIETIPVPDVEGGNFLYEHGGVLESYNLTWRFKAVQTTCWVLLMVERKGVVEDGWAPGPLADFWPILFPEAVLSFWLIWEAADGLTEPGAAGSLGGEIRTPTTVVITP